MDSLHLVCPGCGASLTITNVGSREYCYCEYCGAKVKLVDPNEKTYRIVDEARIREAELKARLKEKELELRPDQEGEYERKSEFSRNFFRKRIFIYLAAAVLCSFLTLAFKPGTIGQAFVFPLIAAVCAILFGSIGHAIALLVKRRRYK